MSVVVVFTDSISYSYEMTSEEGYPKHNKYNKKQEAIYKLGLLN